MIAKCDHIFPGDPAGGRSPGIGATTMTIRLCKILVILSAALIAMLAAVNNVLDYAINFAAVQHVMAMDTLAIDNNSTWRAVELPLLHHVAFVLIILTEAAIGVLGFWGAAELWRVRADAQEFERGKAKALWALTLGVVLWGAGFLGIAAEWYLMWMSEEWNAQQSAFRFAVIFLLSLIFISLREADVRAAAGTGT